MHRVSDSFILFRCICNQFIDGKVENKMKQPNLINERDTKPYIFFLQEVHNQQNHSLKKKSPSPCLVYIHLK
jgi:hypothetical protein